VEKTVLLILFLLCVGCASEPPLAPERLPGWLMSLIRELETQPVASPPAYIAHFEYKGEVVYYLPPRCCDIWSNLYRADGTIVCHPDGGLAGNGDNRCPDFLAERKNGYVIWRDPRGGN
jgi:hypothetical protein